MTITGGAVKEGWPQWYAMAFTQFATASGFSEVSALRWEDIDEGRGSIRIRRGNWRTPDRRVASGDVARAITGHLIQRMNEAAQHSYLGEVGAAYSIEKLSTKNVTGVGVAGGLDPGVGWMP